MQIFSLTKRKNRKCNSDRDSDESQCEEMDLFTTGTFNKIVNRTDSYIH